MNDVPELSYTMREMRCFLPTGWRVEPDAEAGWRPEREAWVTVLRDGSELSWELMVELDQARTLGRSEALRRAMARVKSRVGS